MAACESNYGTSKAMAAPKLDEWFKGVKDLLDDGRVNGSQK